MDLEEKKNPEISPEETQENQKPIEVDAQDGGKVNHPLSPETLKTIIETHNTAILNVTVESYDPVNVAKALEKLSPEDLLFFFKGVKSDASAEVFTYLSQESKEKVVQAFTSSELHSIVDSMATDDLVDFVDELPANLINKVLKAASPEDKQRINTYLNFKDDSAGTLMTPEYLQVKESESVKAAIHKIRKIGKDLETIWEIFVVDKTRKLVGTITLDKLLEEDENLPVKDVMNNDFVSVNVNTDQEIVLQAFRKYDVSVIPVTNKDQRMLGIITFDDVMDVANSEYTEDIQISSAVKPIETPYLKTKVFTLVKNYGIWLTILLALDTFTSMAMSYLSAPLASIPILTSFLPTIMGTNGNASDQTATITVRELALGNITPKNYFKVAFKELRAGFITALVLAVFAFGWMLVELYSGMVRTSSDMDIWNEWYGGNRNLFYISIAALVSLTFLVTTTLAKVLGVTLPVLAKLVHVDPAVMSQPIISTILDILSIVFYYLFALLIMKGL